MEEEKAAAYYDELTRRGGGAAKFKQGLGFSASSSSSDHFPSSKKASPFSLSSFVRASNPKPTDDGGDGKDSSKKTLASASLSNFVRACGASSPKREGGGGDRARVIDSIHEKLNRGGGRRRLSRSRSPEDERERKREKRERSDERERDDEERHSSRKSKEREREKDRERRRRRSRSRSHSPARASRGRDRDRERELSREKDRSSKDRRSGGSRSERDVDYEKLIEGYSRMTPAERVKAKMKLQLSQTAAKDTTIGMSSGWERFDFNKEAPLDDDEDATEVAGDDISIVKNIGRTFRFSAVEARREEELKAAHDRAIFGGAVSSPVNLTIETVGLAKESEENADDAAVENNRNNHNGTSLLSDKVLSMQQGSWRDRARRLQNGS